MAYNEADIKMGITTEGSHVQVMAAARAPSSCAQSGTLARHRSVPNPMIQLVRSRFISGTRTQDPSRHRSRDDDYSKKQTHRNADKREKEGPIAGQMALLVSPLGHLPLRAERQHEAGQRDDEADQRND